MFIPSTCPYGLAKGTSTIICLLTMEESVNRIAAHLNESTLKAVWLVVSKQCHIMIKTKISQTAYLVSV